jgi:hypothetical protein
MNSTLMRVCVSHCLFSCLCTSGVLAFADSVSFAILGSKIDVEGTLFVLRRNAEPRFRILVLNKMSPDDHETDLTETTQLEVSDTYLMMSTPRGIQGYWFYDRQERELVTHQLQSTKSFASFLFNSLTPVLLAEILAELTEQSEDSHPIAIPYVQPSSVQTEHQMPVMQPSYYAPFPQYANVSNVDDLEEPFERERFRAALIKLLREDDDFVDKVCWSE